MAPLLKLLIINVKGFLYSQFSPIPVNLFVNPVPVRHCLDYCFIVSFEIVKSESSSLFFIFKLVLAVLSSLHVNVNFNFHIVQEKMR